MKTLKEYILEQQTEELPEPLWNLDELKKFDKDVDKKVKRDNFSKEEVEEIPGSELSGKNSDKVFKIGDIIYKDLNRRDNQITGKDIKNQPFMISNIRKSDDTNKEWTDGRYGQYLITAWDAAKNYSIDVAQNFKNTDR